MSEKDRTHNIVFLNLWMPKLKQAKLHDTEFTTLFITH